MQRKSNGSCTFAFDCNVVVYQFFAFVRSGMLGMLYLRSSNLPMGTGSSDPLIL